MAGGVQSLLVTQAAPAPSATPAGPGSFCLQPSFFPFLPEPGGVGCVWGGVRGGGEGWNVLFSPTASL